MVEHLPCKQEVVGSIPTFSTIFDLIAHRWLDGDTRFRPQSGAGFYMSSRGDGQGEGIFTIRSPHLYGYGAGFGTIGGSGVFKDLYPAMGEIDFIRISLGL